MTAQRLIDVFFSEKHKLVALGQAVRMVGKIAAFHADGMDFLDILRDGHETRDRTERLAHEVGVKTCHNDSFTLVCKCLGHLDEVFAEELGLVNADDLCLI